MIPDKVSIQGLQKWVTDNSRKKKTVTFFDFMAGFTQTIPFLTEKNPCGFYLFFLIAKIA